MSSILSERTYLFAVRIVKMCQVLNEQDGYVLREKILRSGTAIGALVSEAGYSQSNTEFIYKLSISLKEANETRYWLKLMKDTSIINSEVFDTMDRDLKEVLRMLINGIKTAKANQN